MTTAKLIKKAEDMKFNIYQLQINGGDEIDSHSLIKAYDAIQTFLNSCKD